MRICSFPNFLAKFIAKPRVKVFFTVLTKTIFTGGLSLRSPKTRSQWQFVITKKQIASQHSLLSSGTHDKDYHAAAKIMNKHSEFPRAELDATIQKAAKVAKRLLKRPDQLQFYSKIKKDAALKGISQRDLLFKRCFASLMELKIQKTDANCKKIVVGKATRKIFGEEIIQIKGKTGQLSYFAKQKRLGSGHFNKAYVAIDVSVGKFRVLRQTKKASLTNTEIKDLKKENTLQRKLRSHPELKKHVAKQFLDFYRKPYFGSILEYCDSGTMRKAKEKSLLSLRNKRKLIGDVFVFMKDLHAKGYVYGDFKTENLFIKDGNQLKVGDFGGAYNTLSSSSPKVATVRYLAPEIFATLKTTRATDLWALGIFLYEMKYHYGKQERVPAFFEKVFGILDNLKKLDSNSLKKARKILKEGLNQPERFLKIADPYDQVIIALLKMDPKQRLSSRKALAILKRVPNSSYTTNR